MLLFAKTLWPRNNVRKFDVDAILFREIQCMYRERDIILNVLATFSVRIWLESGNVQEYRPHMFVSLH